MYDVDLYNINILDLKNPSINMVYCVTCGKQMPCGVKHPKKKQTERSKTWALARASGSNSNARGVPRNLIPPAKRIEWVMHGPNVKVKTFAGTVSCSKNVTVTASKDGPYYALNLKDHLMKLLGDTDVKIFSIIIRFCTDQDSGVFGVVKGYNPNEPSSPNALSRRKFVKSEAMGIQILAPTDQNLSEVAPDVYLVFRFNTDYKAGSAIWTRDSYIQHSQPPRIEIPDDILFAESLPAKESVDG